MKGLIFINPYLIPKESVYQAERLKEEFTKLDVAVAKGEGGITLFEDESGNTMLLAIDYTNYDFAKVNELNDITVYFSDRKYVDVIAVEGGKVRKLVGVDGKLDGIVIPLRKHESALLKLI